MNYERILEDFERKFIGYVFPTKTEDVTAVIQSKIGDDGRSDWKFIRLSNGDLVLAVYPTGEMYELISENYT
jgi:hypothetical protein